MLFFFLFFTWMMQFGLEVNLVNFPKAVRPAKRVPSVLPSFRMKNLWELQQRLGKNCRKLLQSPALMQFQTSFRSSSNLHNLNEQFVKLHTSVVTWESFPVREPFHSEKENTHPSRDSLLHIHKTTKYLNEQKEAKKNKSEVDSQRLA